MRFEAISAKAYEHPADRAATSALRSIPLLDKVVKRLADLSHERRLRQILVGDSVRIGEHQVPDLWKRYGEAAWSLDIEPVPSLYVTQAAMANAMTVGAHTPMVVVASSLVTAYEPDEVDAVLAHELGHVLSDHVYYTTAMVLLARFLAGSMPKPLIGLPVRGIYLVLLEWARAAELSSDRASALSPPGPGAATLGRVRRGGGPLPGTVRGHGRPGHGRSPATGGPVRRLAVGPGRLTPDRRGRRRRLRPSLTVPRRSPPPASATASEAPPAASKVAPSRAVAQLG